MNLNLIRYVLKLYHNPLRPSLVSNSFLLLVSLPVFRPASLPDLRLVGVVLRNELVKSLVCVRHVSLVHFVEVQARVLQHVLVLGVKVTVSLSFIQFFLHFIEVKLLLRRAVLRSFLLLRVVDASLARLALVWYTRDC